MTLAWLAHRALLVTLIFACGCGGNTVTTGGHEAPDLLNIGQRLGLKLPNGTEVVGVETEAGIDDAIRAKLRIPASQAKQFLEDCGVARFKQGGANLLGPDHGFWDPHRATTLRWGQVALSSGRFILVVVDDSASDAIVVYAMNFST